MRVSLHEIKQLIDCELPPVDQLVERVNQQLGSVEAVIDLAALYDKAVIVRIVDCHKHPDADKLQVVTIDDGGLVPAVPRDDDGYVQVVCGAPNARTGIYAVWLPPGSPVPASMADETPFVLEARKLRGVMSYGMLAAADELAIGSDHAGIIEVTAADFRDETELRPGLSFAASFGLDCQAIEIENKMFTHRPDLFGHLGVAREIAAIIQGATEATAGEQAIDFHNPSWYQAATTRPDTSSSLPLTVYNDVPMQAPRFMTVVMDQVKVRPSPLWLQCALVAMGSKPVNNIVDLTNYVMLLTAQPTHAYDYDRIAGNQLGVRQARSGETVTLLNDKTYQLTPQDIVIADHEHVVGLAGIMGSRDSQVKDETQRIILECANFDMYTLRKTSMQHGLFTDALTRFTKGQSPLQIDCVMAHLTNLVAVQADARVASQWRQSPQVTDPEQVSLYGEVAASSTFVNNRLGSDLTADQMSNILRRVNITARRDDDTVWYTAPFWRTDIALPEDIVEEVGRLYGFDKLPRELPLRRAALTPRRDSRQVSQQLRQALATHGANEVLSYSFVHGQTLTQAGQSVADAYQIKNALSPDLQYYRLSLIPSLLEKVHPNIKAGYDEFALFEIGKCHNKRLPLDDDGVPTEQLVCDLVYGAKRARQGAAYYQVRQLLADVLASCQLHIKTVRVEPAAPELHDARLVMFAPTRLAAIHEVTTDTVIGYVGELTAAVQAAFKLPAYSAAATLDMAALTPLLARHTSQYRALSRYPAVERDITLAVGPEHEYQAVQTVLQNASQHDEVYVEITPVMIYQPDSATSKKFTFHVRLLPTHRTLDSQAATAIMTSLTQAAAQSLGATVV